MIVKGKEYEVKIRIKTIYKLKEVHGLDLSDIKWNLEDVVKMVHTSIITDYPDSKVTLDDVLDSFDDVKVYNECQKLCLDFLESFIEVSAEAKN